LEHKMRNISKGRVRDAIIGLLSRRPATLTEVSKELGVAKSTASYHLKRLLDEGAVEVVSLKGKEPGSSTAFSASSPFHQTAERDSRLIRELAGELQRERIEWLSNQPAPVTILLLRTLYQSFRVLRNITSLRHEDIMYGVGFEIGSEVISPRIRGAKLWEVCLSLRSLLESNDSSMQVTRQDGSVSFSFASFIGSYSHDPAISSFLRGLLQGAIQVKFGIRYVVVEEKQKGFPGAYIYSVRRRSRHA
jgi:DNA-binding transcriptional ArsR family regulator